MTKTMYIAAVDLDEPVLARVDVIRKNAGGYTCNYYEIVKESIHPIIGQIGYLPPRVNRQKYPIFPTKKEALEHLSKIVSGWEDRAEKTLMRFRYIQKQLQDAIKVDELTNQLEGNYGKAKTQSTGLFRSKA